MRFKIVLKKREPGRVGGGFSKKPLVTNKIKNEGQRHSPKYRESSDKFANIRRNKHSAIYLKTH
jgi:hypothetical protein